MKNNMEKIDEEIEEMEDGLKKQFSNEPKDLFDEIKRLEDRYEYTIDIMRKKFSKEITDTQDECGMQFHQKLNEKRDEVAKEVKEIEHEIDKNLDALKQQEVDVLKTIKEIYKEKSSKLID